jgi:hypothetical protein
MSAFDPSGPIDQGPLAPCPNCKYETPHLHGVCIYCLGNAPEADPRDAELTRLRAALEKIARGQTILLGAQDEARAALLGIDPEDGDAVAAAWAERERAR